MPKVVAFANQKGGTGKSTLTTAVGTLMAKALAKDNLSVCILDADPQATTTRFMFEGRIPPDQTTAYLFDREGQWDIVRKAPQLLHFTRQKNLFVVPSHLAMAVAESRYYEEGSKRLSFFIEGTLADFDVVLIDAPPSLGKIMSNCLLASDYAVIPVQPELPAVEGLGLFKAAIAGAKHVNQGLNVMGIVINQLDERFKDHAKYREMLEITESGNILGVVHAAAVISSAWARRKWIQDVDNTTRPYEELRLLTIAIMRKLGYPHERIG